VKVAPFFPKNMDDPHCLTTSGVVCLKCSSMTSTSDGLRFLTSRFGYQHYSMCELRSFADLGCPLCRLCCSRIYHSQISFKRSRSLRFYAQGSDGRTTDGQHVFEISKLVFRIQDKKATLKTSFELHAYTSKGIC